MPRKSRSELGVSGQINKDMFAKYKPPAFNGFQIPKTT